MVRVAHVLPTANFFYSQGYPEKFGPVKGGGKAPACPDPTSGATWIFSEPLSNHVVAGNGSFIHSFNITVLKPLIPASCIHCLHHSERLNSNSGEVLLSQQCGILCGKNIHISCCKLSTVPVSTPLSQHKSNTVRESVVLAHYFNASITTRQMHVAICRTVQYIYILANLSICRYNLVIILHNLRACDNYKGVILTVKGHCGVMFLQSSTCMPLAS